MQNNYTINRDIYIIILRRSVRPLFQIKYPIFSVSHDLFCKTDVRIYFLPQCKWNVK